MATQHRATTSTSDFRESQTKLSLACQAWFNHIIKRPAICVIGTRS